MLIKKTLDIKYAKKVLFTKCATFPISVFDITVCIYYLITTCICHNIEKWCLIYESHFLYSPRAYNPCYFITIYPQRDAGVQLEIMTALRM